MIDYDVQWALIASRINSILGLALDFLFGSTVFAIKARCRFSKHFKLNVGQFSHLADFVTRINYKNFYMSDTWNMITACTTGPFN